MATAFLDRVVNKAIGELLIEKGTVTAEQVDEALTRSRTDGIRLGEALLRLGYVTQDALNYALGEQYGVRPMELHPSMLDERLIRRFPIELLEQHGVIPLIEMGNEIVVVMSDPNRMAGLAELRRLAPGYSVSPQLADEEQIRRCLVALRHTLRRPGAGRMPGEFGGDSTIDLPVTETAPMATDPEYTAWLLATCLSRPESDLLLRVVGAEGQVAHVAETVQEAHRFSSDAFPAVRDAIWKNCIALEHTHGSAGRWSHHVRHEGRVYEILVLMGAAARKQSLRLRALRMPSDDTAPTRVPAVFPRVRPGVCTVVLYDDPQGLERYVQEFLLQFGAGNIMLLSQRATRVAWESVLALPAGQADLVVAAVAEGATCLIYDHPVSSTEVARALRCSFQPPAVVVCAPVVSDAGGAIGISPDIDEIRTRLLPDLITLRAGAASQAPASTKDGGNA